MLSAMEGGGSVTPLSERGVGKGSRNPHPPPLIGMGEKLAPNHL